MTTTLRPRGPLLHPRIAILVRACGTVQLGWDPETAVLCDVPGMGTRQILEFLRLLDGLTSRPAILWQARSIGFTGEQALALLEVIDAAGLIVHPPNPAGRVRTIRVHGVGPLADEIVAGLAKLGIRAARSRQYRGEADLLARRPDLVVLTDALVPDPRLVHDLCGARIAHLVVRVRDGKGLVGPLVLPGSTSCLRCADLTRCDYDAEWPRLAAQLLGRAGHAGPAGIAMVTALALAELETIIACEPGNQPQTLNRTVEIDLGTRQIEYRSWPPHPRCGCGAGGHGDAL